MSSPVWRIVWSIDTFLSQLSSAAILAATSPCSRYNRIARRLLGRRSLEITVCFDRDVEARCFGELQMYRKL